MQEAHYDARAKKAEYIPDVSLAFNYFTTANFPERVAKQHRSSGFATYLGAVGLGAQTEKNTHRSA